jgi:cellulose synthase/poly-beta-1,6-N-acetylglucosamine synthase-like glycosyltransferase
VIEALLAQDRPLDRIIVVSDNSTDRTYEIACSYRDRGVTAVETCGNRHKKAGALDQSWSMFGQDADLLITLDADTILPPNAVGDWEQEFLADPSLAGSSSKITMPGSGFSRPLAAVRVRDVDRHRAPAGLDKRARRHGELHPQRRAAQDHEVPGPE